MSEVYWYPWPVIVKPTDAAGSKGVTKVEKAENLRPALEYAMQHSPRLEELVAERFNINVGRKPTINRE